MTDIGMHYSAHRKLEDGRDIDRVSPCILPNVRSVPDVQLAAGEATRIGWVVPMDDTNHLLFHAFVTPKANPGWPRGRQRAWGEMTADERQRLPGDWEAQLGQGAITLHSEEHMGASDKGIIQLRKLLKNQMRVVQQGGDPMGLVYDPAKVVLKAGSGNFYRKHPE